MDRAPSDAAPDSTASRVFRRELRRLRTAHGLTQRALADRVRFSRETIAAVESGRRYGSRELAVRCDEALDTGGRLASLWPDVACEQAAADGRRGRRERLVPRPRTPADDIVAMIVDNGAMRSPTEVVVEIDDLRTVIDRALSGARRSR
jgi:transcriptional regulator with XRE-family HTH domain